MRKNHRTADPCATALVSGTAADVAISDAKQNREKSWEDLRAVVARQG
jgi:hypothetical protein